MRMISSPLRYSSLAAAIGLFLHLPLHAAESDGFFFPSGSLSILGVSQEEAEELMKQAGRFADGSHKVAFYVNGLLVNTDYKLRVENGYPCLSENLLRQLGINPLNLPFAGDCLDYAKATQAVNQQQHYFFEDIEVRFQPLQQAVYFNVPISRQQTAERYRSGGTAMILNYSFSGVRSEYADRKTQHYSGFISTGVNLGNWVFRHRGTLSGGQSQSTQYYAGITYLTRSFSDWQKRLTLGQFSTDSHFFTTSLRGVQWSPEYALQEQEQTLLSGIARAAARVEIYQGNDLLYIGQVDAGAFQLSGVNIANVTQGAEMVLTYQDGQVERRQISAAELSAWGYRNNPSGFSIAVGQLDVPRLVDNYQRPWVAQLSYQQPIFQGISWRNDIAGSEKYLGLGTGIYVPFDRFNLNVNGYLARDFRLNQDEFGQTVQQKTVGKGGDVNLSYYLFDRNLSLSHGLWWRDKNFRFIEEEYPQVVKYQFSNQIQWSMGHWGYIGAGYNRNRYHDGKNRNNYQLYWNYNWRNISLGLSMQQQHYQNAHGQRKKERGVYLTFNLRPSENYGGGNIYARYAKYDNGQTQSVMYRNDTRYFHYGIGGNRYQYQGQQHRQELIAELGATPFKRFSINTTGVFSEKRKVYFGYLSGSTAWADSSLLFSPYTIGDTFGVVDTGVSGMDINTPAGTVRTDYQGKALIPTLPAFHEGRVAINTTDLSDDIEVYQAEQTVSAYRGGVITLPLEAKRLERVILLLSQNGSPLKSTFFAKDMESGRFIGMADREGRLLLSEKPQNAFSINDGTTNCVVNPQRLQPAEKQGRFATFIAPCEAP